MTESPGQELTPGSADVSCTHCGLPVPHALVRAGSDEQFCCSGCETVYGVIHGEGLERYYELRRDQDFTPEPARTSGRSYEEFDDPSFTELYGREVAPGLQSIELYLEGVHCAACVWLVERVPVVAEGVAEVRLDVGRARARVTWNPDRIELSRVARLLDSMGYPSHPFRGVKAEEMARKEDRALLIKMAVAGASAGNVMLIAFCLYSGVFTGMDPALERYFRWASLVITLPAVIWSASVFYRGAWGALRTRALHMDVPVSLGILAGFSWGTVSTILGRGEVYFDSVTVLIFLLLVGRFLLRRQQRGAADAAELLHALAPSTARLVEEGRVREVPVEALLPGTLVEVRAGDSVPADGTVCEGESTLDLSLLTGESRPVPCALGDEVNAGTVNISARLVLRVDSTGENTRLGKLLEMVQEHAQRRAPIVQLADRISGWFVAAVIVLALATFAIWVGHDTAEAVDHTVALLIVTCPCALGLATPLAVSAAIGKAARAGLLVKGGDVIERLARPGRLWLDKTGTLTEGRTALVRWEGDDRVKPLLAALETHSAHPVARALVAALGAPGLPSGNVQETRGGGIEGLVGGESVIAGSPRFVETRGACIGADLAASLEAILDEGLTPVVVATGGVARAVAGLGDPLRGDAEAALEALRDLGYRPGILSGDHPRVVAVVGRTLGIEGDEARGGQTPEDKLAEVERSLEEGPVVMVGDGVNDAAALAAATAGIGVHGGAEATLAVADVHVARPGLAPVAELVHGSWRTLAIVRRNLVFSLAYNVVGAGLSMAGLISPLVAAILMPASSLTVIAISYRSRSFDGV